MCSATVRSGTAGMVLAGLMALWLGCAAVKDAGEVPPRTLDLASVAVLSFHPLFPPEGENVVRSFFGGGTFLAGRIGSDAPATLDTLLRDKLARDPKYVFVSRQRTERIWRTSELETMPGRDSERRFFQEVRSLTDAEAVLLGEVYAYEDRKGTAYGAEAPAYVAFDLLLLRLESGAVLWRGVFSRRQKDLAQNVFDLGDFFKAGGRWLTAADLAALGLDKVMETYPQVKGPGEVES